MTAHTVELNDCGRDPEEVTVRIGDTIRWTNHTERRVNLMLPEPKILYPRDAQTMIEPGHSTIDYTVESGSGRRDYSFQCVGPSLAPRTGTINVEG